MDYVLFSQPRPLAELVPASVATSGSFSLALGYTAFCDLILQDPTTKEIAFLIAVDWGVVSTGQLDLSGFVSDFLSDPDVISNVLRTNDLNTLRTRLGTLAADEGFFPVPHPAIGGSGDLDTYDKGNVFVHLEFLAQALS